MIDQVFAPGLANPVFEAQAIFRQALMALSRPGFDFSLELGQLPAKTPLPPLAAGLALTFLDFDTKVWLSPTWAGAKGWLGFHNGPRFTEEPGEADFVLAAGFDELPDLSSLAQGDDRYPDRSATVIVQTEIGANYGPLWAQGPGLKEDKAWPDLQLSENFVQKWNQNHSQYPLGVDMIFINNCTLWALPRSVKLLTERALVA